MILWLLILCALAIRVVYATNHPIESRDGIFYVNFCNSWFTGGTAALPFELQSKPLLYQYCVCALMRLGISAFDAALWLNLIVGSLLMLPIYFFGKIFFEDKKAALWLVALAAVMPPLVEYSALRLRETFYLFFAAWTICAWGFCIKGCRYQWFWLMICGAAAMLATQCRYEGGELIIFGISLPCYMLYQRTGWKKALLAAVLFGVGIILCGVAVYCLPGMPNYFWIYFHRFRLL